MSYRICPNRGAALDPGERCDCQDTPESQTPGNPGKKEAAPVLQHQSGKVEKVLTDHISTAILTEKQEEIKHVQAD